MRQGGRRRTPYDFAAKLRLMRYVFRLMADIGRTNNLTVIKEAHQGVYLDGGPHGEILVPRRYVPQGALPGSEMKVFVYRDSEDRLVATTETPAAEVGQYACMEVVGIHQQTGAFLNWGLSKDLLLPFMEQSREVRPGDRVVAYVMLDEKTDRIVATMRFNRFLHKAPVLYDEGQPVSLLVYEKTPLGYNAIINNSHRGLIYNNDVNAPLRRGQQLEGFIRTVHEDGKIDLALDRSGYGRVVSLADAIMDSLKANGGVLELDDSSSPERIREMFGSSKKAFKQAVGSLYSRRLIRLGDGRIELAAK